MIFSVSILRKVGKTTIVTHGRFTMLVWIRTMKFNPFLVKLNVDLSIFYDRTDCHIL